LPPHPTPPHRTHLARLLHQGGEGGVWRGAPAGVVLVKPGAALLPQPLVLVEQLDDAGGVRALGEGVEDVLAHVQAHVGAHQVAQPAGAKGRQGEAGGEF
jgi:hypothetical protein